MSYGPGSPLCRNLWRSLALQLPLLLQVITNWSQAPISEFLIELPVVCFPWAHKALIYVPLLRTHTSLPENVRLPLHVCFFLRLQTHLNDLWLEPPSLGIYQQ